MKRQRHPLSRKRQGSVLILALIFLAIFAAMAIAMATLSGTNVQIAENLQKLDGTRGCAESGLEVVRYWMSQVAMSGTTPANQRFTELASNLQSALTDAGVTNIAPVCSGSTVTIPSVSLDSSDNQSFSAVLTRIDNNNVQVDVTGHYGTVTRTVRSNYFFTTRANTVFDFGVASKGPIALSGNIELTGVNIEVESNAYIESANHLLALSITGNSHIAGSVKIVNPMGYVHLQGGQAGIGGDTGLDAMKHVQIGAAPAEFPEMDPNEFTGYATNVLQPGQSTVAGATFENLVIPAGMNPNFAGGVTLKGVIFVQKPNVVTFTGGVDVTGIIVTNGDPTDDSGVNQIAFQGNVNSLPISGLPQEPQFEGLHDQMGTFIMAPGFGVSFSGNFSALNGAIAANGIAFSGNAGGTVYGSIINYASDQMVLSGNNNLYFNRSGLTEVPAGFVPEIIMEYDPASYTEVL
jgi:Tfp pilus assembly protein PilX